MKNKHGVACTKVKCTHGSVQVLVRSGQVRTGQGWSAVGCRDVCSGPVGLSGNTALSFLHSHPLGGNFTGFPM